MALCCPGAWAFSRMSRRTYRFCSASSSKRPHRALSGGNGIVLLPASAGVLIEIHAGIDGFVDGVRSKPGICLGNSEKNGRCCLGHGKNGGEQHRENKDNSNPHYDLVRVSDCRHGIAAMSDRRAVMHRNTTTGAMQGDGESKGNEMAPTQTTHKWCSNDQGTICEHAEAGERASALPLQTPARQGLKPQSD